MFEQNLVGRLGFFLSIFVLASACEPGDIGGIVATPEPGPEYGGIDNRMGEVPSSEPGGPANPIASVCPGASPDVSASNGWRSSAASQPASDALYFEFKVRPGAANLDGLVAVGAEDINDFAKAALAVRFADNGLVDVRDGAFYSSDVSYTYDPALWYNVAISADIATETYDVEIGRCGEQRETLIKGASFRHDASVSGQLSTWAVWSSQAAALELATPTWMTSGGCAPATCQSLGQECGQPSNGCGGSLNCGGCGSSEACASGLCVDNSPPPPEPTPPPMIPPPSGGGGDPDRPWAHNTGPSNVGALVSTPAPTITVDGTVLENIDVTGRIKIDADNVTIRNFRVRATSSYGIQIVNGHSGIVLEDGEIIGSDSACIFGVGYTARRLHAHDGNGDILKVQGSGGPTLIEYSFIEKAGADGEGHADGNQTAAGSGSGGSNASITFRNNNIWMPSPGTPSYEPPYKSNANFMLEDGISNFVIEDNWLNGGNYTIYCRDGSATGVFVRNNKFGRDYNYGIKIGDCAQWSGNTWEDTGGPI